MTVLIIEDDPLISEMVSVVLMAAGHRVLVADDGIAGLRYAQDEHPDLVLTDIALPGMDGLEVARQIAADPTIGAMPVVLMSAGAMPRPGTHRAFLEKPLDFAMLLRIAEHCIAVE